MVLAGTCRVAISLNLQLKLQLKQGERVLYEKQIGWLKANVALSLASDWVAKVNYEKEPVKLVIQP